MPYSPTRIASLQPSITAVLHALGELHRVVACTKYCADVVPEIGDRGIPIIHDSWSADASEIIAAKPDLVIASVPYRMESLAAILKAGVAVMTFAPHSLADIYRDMQYIANLVDSSARGVALIDEMKAKIDSVRRRINTVSRPRVSCEEWGKPLIHSQHWVAELIDAAGGDFLGTPGAHTTAEEVASASPDVIVAAWCGAGDRVPLERIIEQRGWQKLDAVRAHRVFCINDELLNTPAHTLLGGLQALASAIHPAIFGGEAMGLRQIIHVRMGV